MRPQFLTINGQKIAWYESRKEGFPIIFIHGNSLSAKSFKKQFECKLLSEYRLIAFDFPGHGVSDFAKNPEEMYNLFGYSDLLIEIFNQLQIEEAIFIGHSMGGHIILHANEKLKVKIKGIVVFGTPPIKIPVDVEHAYIPNPAFSLAFKDHLTKEELTELANAYVISKDNLIDEITEEISRTDPQMRLNMGKASLESKFIDETKAVKEITFPIAILHGEKDSMINPEYFKSLDIPTLWRDNAQIIKDSGHCPQMEKPEEFNRILNEFIVDIMN